MALSPRIAGTVTVVFATLSAGWSGARLMLDLVGHALTVEDFVNPQGIVARGLVWLFSTPWWVPGLIAGALGGAMIALLNVLVVTLARESFPDPALPEPLSDENAKKEAAEVASGRYDENEFARTDQLRHRVHLVMLVGIWSILILIGIFAVAWHYLAPKQWE